MTNKQIHDPVKASDVYLKQGSGQNLHDHIRGKYWHIMLGNKRVGKIYIDFKENEVLGNHPSLDIFINKQFQGRHIGRYAYELACLESALDKVYMHTRKSNIGSIRAAEEAGFKHIEHPAFKQIVMVWERKI
ncbi:GNAT family N-acetyltransferase [Pedobacter sp. P26]|uniref:GNAT family N-acetyltransferase n=1 Tax=Pedobacter sp. P26 TaxID=3423956 RepID=UPI003D66E2C7